MGAVLQTAGVAELAAELTCCACSSICGLAARDSATRAKFRYCSFLMLATVTCVIALIPGLRTKLDKIPNLCSKVLSPDTCDKFVGFSAVYRILFAMAVFHLILAVLTIKVTRVKSFRARFNNGLWMFKMGLIFGLTFATFYIPKRSGFFRIWMYFSLSGGFMFVMFQIILVIDFGHSWSLSWAEKLETGNTKLWYFAMALTTFFMFAMSFGALVSFYAFFTHPLDFMKCHANVFYISFMGIQCLLATVISVTPTVQQEIAGTGLLQSSVVVLYALYLTWNTLASEPDSSCNPLGNVILEYDSFTGVSGEAIFGCLITLILLIFACTVRAGTSHLSKYGLALAESENYALAIYYEDSSKDKVESELENGDKEVSLSEYVGYNYSFFHIILSLASLNILMVLTNWHSPEENSNMKTLVKNWASVWVQMASSFACIMMYVWFLVTPLLKKVWGPIFGIDINETRIYKKQHPDKLKSISKYATVNTKDLKDKLVRESLPAQIIQTKNINTVVVHTPEHIYNRPKNTHNPTLEVNHFQQKTSAKNKSNESLTTINLSQISRQTTNNTLKQRRKLYTIESTNDNLQQNSIPDKIISQKTFNYDDNIQRRKRFTKKRFSKYEHFNSSIESVNSWVSTSYRRKYQPLRNYSNNNKKHDYNTDRDTINDKLSPIEDTSFEHVNTTSLKESLQKTLPVDFNRGVENTSDFSCQNYKHRKRKKQKSVVNKEKTVDIIQDKIDTFQSSKNNTTVQNDNTMTNSSILQNNDNLPNKKHLEPPKNNLTTNKQNHFQYESYSKDGNDTSDFDINNRNRRKKKKKRKSIISECRTIIQDNETIKSNLPNNKSNLQNSRTKDIPKNKISKSIDDYSEDDIKQKRKRKTRRSSVIDKTTTMQNNNIILTTTNTRAKKTFTATENHLFTKIKTHHSQGTATNSKLELVEEPVQNEIWIGDTNKIEDNIVNKKKTTKKENISVSRGYLTEDISIVPSIFKRKPQNTETAGELLKLQWKILRTQAKIVKIQERIFRLQSDEPPPGVGDESRQLENELTNSKKKNTGKNKGIKNYKKRRRSDDTRTS